MRLITNSLYSLIKIVCWPLYICLTDTLYLIFVYSGDLVKRWQVTQKAGAGVKIAYSISIDSHGWAAGWKVVTDTSHSMSKVELTLIDIRALCKGLTLKQYAYTIHINRKPVEVSEGESDVIARSKVHYEASHGVLYSLQRAIVDFDRPARQGRKPWGDRGDRR